MSKKKIVYDRWNAIPADFGGERINDTEIQPGMIDELTSAATIRLYIKVAIFCARTGRIRISNADLMRASSLSEASFHRARKELKECGVLKWDDRDKKSDTYTYSIGEYMPNVVDNAGADESAIIDRTEQLRMVLTVVPTLRGKPGRSYAYCAAERGP